MTFRETDEMHLEWLRLADQGVTFTAIAKLHAVSRAAVAGQVGRIRREIKAMEAA